jgi:tetratricopeptide (TPR) repeat protein
MRDGGYGETTMHRWMTLVWVSLIAVSVSAATARADDADSCRNATNDTADKAIAACTRLLNVNPKNDTAFTNRGNAYRNKGDYDRAIADATEAIRLNPKNDTAFTYRGSAYRNKGDYDRAVADATEAIRLNPKNDTAFNNRGFAYNIKGDYDRAIADYSEAIRLNPQNTLAFDNRGSAYYNKGDYDRAIADANEVIRLNPKLARAYVHRGEGYLLKSDPVKAATEFETALQLNPNDADAQKGLERARAAKLAINSASPQGVGTEQAVTTPAISGKPTGPALVVPPPPAALTKPLGSNERRVALVVGNSAYSSVQELPNPRRDAAAIAAVLRSLGFQTVMLESDLSRERLVSALRSFAAEADRADWAVIYFAGHGIEVGGINYLIPVDAHLVTDRDVQFEAVPLDQLLGAVEGARKLRLVMLDACRENPFKMQRTLASRSVGRGFTRVEPAPGTLVAYAAKDGQVALDGDSANSPFATALLKEIKAPGLEIRRLLGFVHDDVMEMTGNRQEPYIYGALPGRQDFFFVAQ